MIVCRSRTPITSKMELFLTLVKGFQPLTNIKKLQLRCCIDTYLDFDGDISHKQNESASKSNVTCHLEIAWTIFINQGQLISHDSKQNVTLFWYSVLTFTVNFYTPVFSNLSLPPLLLFLLPCFFG